MNTVDKNKRNPVAVAIAHAVAPAIALALFSWQSTAAAQDQEAAEPAITTPDLPEAGDGEAVDEVVVMGRFISSSQQLVNERIDDSYVTDVLGEDSIGPSCMAHPGVCAPS